MPTQAPKGLGNVVPLGNADTVPQGSPPSSYAAYAVVRREPGALVRFTGLTVLRSLLIAPGMALAGVKGRPLLLGSLAASGVISLTALGYCWAGNRQTSPGPLQPDHTAPPPPPPGTTQTVQEPYEDPTAVDTEGEEVQGVGDVRGTV